MASTPPPPGRVRTPPAPLLGARYDNYEPCSPRRSARVSAKHRDSRASPEPGPSQVNVKYQIFAGLTSTPAPHKKVLARQQSSQTLSPPSSPDAIHRQATPVSVSKRATTGHSYNNPSIARNIFPGRSNITLHEDEVETEHSGPTQMLPTPNKTPQKRVSASMASTARILNFKACNVEDILPSPRKRKLPSSLDSLTQQATRQGRKVEIFTDSQDRVPRVEMTEENPFVGPRKISSPPRDVRSRKTSRQVAEDASMEEAVKNDEGIVYIFRGRKIFRRFDNTTAESDEEDHGCGTTTLDAAIRRQAGEAANRPFTRSSLKPRLLFPSGNKSEDDHQPDVDDEEALTDIEDEHSGTSSIDRVATHGSHLQTPVKNFASKAGPGQLTPTSRSVKRKSTRLVELEPVEEEPLESSPSTSTATSQVKGKNLSPFDSWQRTKPGVSAPATHGRKRSAAPEEEVTGGKRTRSSAH